MNEEKVKRGRGRPIGGISHIRISTSELAKYCADHPNDIIMVSRVFWEKKMAESITDTLVEIKPENIGVIKTDDLPRVLGDMFMQPLEINASQIEMKLSE